MFHSCEIKSGSGLGKRLTQTHVIDTTQRHACICVLSITLLPLTTTHAQVPSRDLSMTPEEALKHFQQEVPTLGILGSPHFINPDTPYTVDEEVQLVCKYLKALHIGGEKGIDKLYQEGEVQVLPVTTG